METEIVKTAVELAGAYGPLAAIAAIIVGAILLVLYRRARKAIPVLRLVPTDPGPAPKMPDVSEVPSAEWGAGLPPDGHPPG